MSQGLRFLFDRNNAHLVVCAMNVGSSFQLLNVTYLLQDLFTEGWHPPISTEAVMAVSLGTM